MARLGATFLTVHAYPQTMQAAVEAREGDLRILAVTVLTSYNDDDLAAAGYDLTVEELVAARAAQARDLGVDGLVCSAEEAAKLRGIVGTRMSLVTPGIRPAGAERGDQKRIATPAAAIAAGADYLVVGRPIIAAADPKAAARGDHRGNRPTKSRRRNNMAKGYWIAHVDVHNEDGYKPYAAANPGIFKKFGGRFVVRAGKFEVRRGHDPVAERGDRISRLRRGAGLLRSPEYQANIKVRQPHATPISSSSKATTARSRNSPVSPRGGGGDEQLPPIPRPAISGGNRRHAMSDMRLVIAGAGGRMGRTLVHAIAATKGVTLAGAVEAAGSAVIGRDAGELAGLGPNGIKVTSDVAPLLQGRRRADRIRASRGDARAWRS